MLNEVRAVFGGGRETETLPLYQYDYGQRLVVYGPSLPGSYEVHFSNDKTGVAKTQIGDLTGVSIPDEYLISGADIFAWIFVHEGNSDGETKYIIKIPVKKRARPSDDPPTPEDQSVITQAIAALSGAVERAQESAESAEASAQRAEDAAESIDKDAIEEAVAEYLDEHPVTVDETDPTVPAWAKQPTKPSYTAEEVGALSMSDLSDAIDTALAEAKASGEFDGEDGAPGAPGAKGDKGDKGDSYILTAADKAEIAGMVETTVDDVQINGTSIVEDNIAKIPVAGEKLGAVKIGATQGRYGLRTNNEGNIFVEKAASSTVKNGAESYQPIVPATQHEAAFYGLAKVAGYDERGSELTVGQYTDEAKAAIKSMLGVQDNMVVNVTGTGEICSVDHTFAEIASALFRGINVVVDDTDAVQPYVGRVDINGAVYLAFGVSATYNGVSALTGYLITGMGDGYTVALRVEQNTNIVSDVKVNGASVVDGGVASISVTDGKDGKDGADGHTPVKGVDYWTSADKAELVADVLAEFVDLTEVAQ